MSWSCLEKFQADGIPDTRTAVAEVPKPEQALHAPGRKMTPV